MLYSILQMHCATKVEPSLRLRISMKSHISSTSEQRLRRQPGALPALRKTGSAADYRVNPTFIHSK
jgi:hypothetical protein